MRGKWLARRVADRVLVHTTDERSLQGILSLIAKDGIVLRDAKYLESESSVPLGGEIFVPKDKVLFVQVAG